MDSSWNQSLEPLPQPAGGQAPVVAQGGEAGSAVAVAAGALSELDEDAAGLEAESFTYQPEPLNCRAGAVSGR